MSDEMPITEFSAAMRKALNELKAMEVEWEIDEAKVTGLKGKASFLLQDNGTLD